MLASILVTLAFAAAPAPDVPFVQETHEAYPLLSEAANDVRCITVAPTGDVYAGSADNVYRLIRGSNSWHPIFDEETAGPVFALACNSDGVWAGTWNGLWRITEDSPTRYWETAPVHAVHADGTSVAAASGQNVYRLQHLDGSSRELPIARTAREILPARSANDVIYIATGMGLYSGASLHLLTSEEGLVSENVRGLAYDADGLVWAVGLGGCSVLKDGVVSATYTAADGLPSALASCVARAPDDTMWIGTERGVARKTQSGFSVRCSRRWLVNDDVRDIAFDAEGTAWIATAGGVSAICRREMTLAEKAAFFQDELLARHVRPPWFVEKNRMPTPGDRSVFLPEDDDNDGEYTAEYTVAECFRFRATGNEEAREYARRGMQALIPLQTITGTSGFIARTFIPSEWERMHDPNRTYSERERAEEFASDPRFKPVEQRWRPTPDGKFLWKGDTSSDEITGHYYAFQTYFDLAANDEEKAQLRDHVARVTDWIIDGGYVLRDIDGEHTRWGVWSPEKLNHDPDWQAERGINSAEICSFLLVAHHITGDAKYRKEYERLLFEENYLENIRRAKTFRPAQITHIDDCLLVKVYPSLFKYEKQEKILAVYRESLERWYAGIRNEQNPWFNFSYGMIAGEDPQRPDSLFFLRDTPLDRIAWTFDHRLREDLHMVRAPILEEPSTNRLLPPSERATVRWDKNPFDLIAGDGGETEWAPTFWLLAYWMGRYGGFVAAP